MSGPGGGLGGGGVRRGGLGAGIHGWRGRASAEEPWGLGRWCARRSQPPSGTPSHRQPTRATCPRCRAPPPAWGLPLPSDTPPRRQPTAGAPGGLVPPTGMPLTASFSGPGLSCELPRQRLFPPSRSSRRRAARPSPLASHSHPPQLVSCTSEQPLLLRPFASSDSPLLRAPQRLPHFSELQLFFREVLTLLRAPTHGSRFPSTPTIHLQKPRAHTPPCSPMVLGTRALGLLAFPLGTCHEGRRCVG